MSKHRKGQKSTHFLDLIDNRLLMKQIHNL
jgi:hypothetical protein